MKENFYIYLFSGTHWDREWYLPFEKFRILLVEMFDELLDFLNSIPAFGVFHLDGQMVMIEDYLQIRPEKRDLLERHLLEGRIIAGPWYCMPDEFLCSGESLIRNLETGFRMCKSRGVEPWKVGYLCDTFGHIAQMPQILVGFGIEFGIVGRGVNEHTTPAFFRWQSPNGSSINTFKLNDRHGYGHLKKLSMEPFGEKDTLSISEKLKEFCFEEMGRTSLPIICLTDANDHQFVRTNTGQILEILQNSFPKSTILHINLMKMSEEVEPFTEQLPVRNGELREPGRKIGLPILSHVLSSRYDIKKQNDICQSLLEKYVQPMIASGFAESGHFLANFVEEAYKYLLKNQAHDSICGCSVDQVHRDMHYRYDQCRLICEGLIERMYPPVSLTQSEDLDALWLDIFNSLPYKREGIFDICLDIPEGFGKVYRDPFSGESYQNFVLTDKNGSSIPYVINKIERNIKKRIYKKQIEIVDRYHLTIQASLAPLSSTALQVVPEAEKRNRFFSLMETENLSAENSYLKLVINRDGTFDVFDKETGMNYKGFNQFVSRSDMGDGWYYNQPLETQAAFTSSEVLIRCIARSNLKTTFIIEQILKVSKCLIWSGRINENFGGIHPSEEKTTIGITSEISLDADSRIIKLNINIDNSVKDHRVRMLVPVCASKTWFTDQPFCFIERLAGRDSSTDGWDEPDPYERPFSGIVGRLNSQGSGIAFLSAYGLHEAAVIDENDPDIYITLFRAFRRTRDTDGESDCQLQKGLEFSTAIMFLQKTDGYGAMVRNLERLQAPPLSRTLTHMETLEGLIETDGDGDIVVSLIRPTETAHCIYIRLVNLAGETKNIMLGFRYCIAEATRISLLGEHIEELPIVGKSELKVTLCIYEISTIKVCFNNR